MNKNIDSTFYNQKRRTQMTSRKPEQALLTCKRLISLDYSQSSHHSAWAQIKSNQEEYRSAERKFREAMILKPNDPSVFLEFGRCYAKQKKYDQAIALFTKGLAISSRYGQILLLREIATSCMEKGDYSQASEWFEKAIPVSFSDASLINDLGYVHLLQGNYHVAISKFDHAIEANNGNSLPFLHKAIVFLCQEGEDKNIFATKGDEKYQKDEFKEIYQEGILLIKKRTKQEGVSTLKSYVSKYSGDMNRLLETLKKPGTDPKRKVHLEKLTRSFQKILDLLKMEIEDLEKQL